MPIPQFMSDLLQLLLDLAVPSAMCTLVLAGVALRNEGGANFESGGRFTKRILWTVILLTVPPMLSWVAGQRAMIPPSTGGVSRSSIPGNVNTLYTLI